MIEEYYAVPIGSSLSHHGVPGMHWGVRRTPEQLGHTKAQKARSEHFRAFNAAKKFLPKKRLSKMTDAEIKKAIADKKKSEKDKENRKKLEAEYKQVVKGKKVKSQPDVAKPAKSDKSAKNKNDQSNSEFKEKAKKFLAAKGAKALDKATDAAIDVGAEYIKKKLKEATGLSVDDAKDVKSFAKEAAGLSDDALKAYNKRAEAEQKYIGYRKKGQSAETSSSEEKTSKEPSAEVKTEKTKSGGKESSGKQKGEYYEQTVEPMPKKKKEKKSKSKPKSKPDIIYDKPGLVVYRG